MTDSTLTFTTTSPQSTVGGSPGLVWSLPSFLDPSFSASFSTSVLDYTMIAGVSLTAGLSGGVDLTFGQYSLGYAITVDPGLPTGPVLDGAVFTVDPTLVSTDDGSFALNGPGLNASLSLAAIGGINFIFNPNSLVDASFTVNPSFSLGYALPSSFTLQPATGSTITISEPAGFSTLVPNTTGSGSLVPVSGSGTDSSFLSASVDAIAVLAHFLGPEVSSVLDGSHGISIASLAWSLLSAPLAASLSLDQGVTLTPTGVGVTLQEMQNTTVLQTDTGTLGQAFSFTAPDTGSGAVQIDATYTLNFQVTSATGILGDINFSIEGPQVSGTIASASFSVGPFGSYQVFDYTAGLGTIDSETFSSSLTTTDTYDISYAPTSCFFAGTRVLTDRGEVPVEELRAGDRVMTVDGAARALETVRWVGRNVVSRRFADPLRVLPIRIRAGALGDSVPTRDLLVSPDHGVLVDGVLAHAHALVNGASIVREPAVPLEFTYYHVELDRHALLLAEGTPAESFLDGVEDMAFVNWAERVRPDSVAALPHPRPKSARQVPRHIRDRLAARIIALGLNTAA
jgi:hypothetical protein